MNTLEELIGNMSLDDLIAAIRSVIGRRFPDAPCAALMIDRPGLPETILPVRLVPNARQPADAC